MADIELVIKIPEDEYQNILLTGKASFRAVNAIEAGTLLPKGHGKLIDMNTLDKDFSKWCICKCDCSCLICPVYNQKAIIEADTKNERGE